MKKGILTKLRPHQNAGFTMIEMIMVIVIIAIIYSFAAPTFSRFTTRKKLQLEAKKVSDTIQVTKSLATSSRKQMKIEFDTGNGEYYYLDAAESGKQFHQDKVNRLDTSVQFLSVPSEIIFKTNGEVLNASSPITLTLESNGKKKIDIELNHRTGRTTVGELY